MVFGEKKDRRTRSDSRSSLFAPKPRGNARYEGYPTRRQLDTTRDTIECKQEPVASNTSYDWTACERIIWREAVSENGTVAMIGSNREMNVVRMFIAAVCWGEACVA